MTCHLKQLQDRIICTNWGQQSSLSSRPRCPTATGLVEQIDSFVQSDAASRAGGFLMAAVILFAVLFWSVRIVADLIQTRL